MLPIETYRDGNKITKVCPEDVYKLLNKIINSLDDSYNNSMEIIEEVHKLYNDCEGEIIVGIGNSEPCKNDEFNEEIGNEIAFRKAKLNANIKKLRLINRVINQLRKAMYNIAEEGERLSVFIDKDIDALKEFNPDFEWFV